MGRIFKGMWITLLVVAVVGLAWVAYSRRSTTVSENSTLCVSLETPMAESGVPNLFQAFGGEHRTLRDTVAMLRRAKTDTHIKAVVILPSGSSGLWAQVQELRAAVADLRASGKHVVAYLESGDAQEYYLASAANRILLMPGGSLDLTGLATYELFFRGALDKLGVSADMLHIGDYKTYSNTFVEKGMTAAHREMNVALNRDQYDELVRAIAAGRGKTDIEVRAALDNGPYQGAGAVTAGLVDALAYEDQIDDTAPIAGTRRLTDDDYGVHGDAPGFRAPKIAVLYAVGDIASGSSATSPTGGTTLGSDTFTRWIRKVRGDKDVRAIVIRIDSPGGSAIASEVIWRELMLTRDVKPVIVSMGDVAASGGYYIAVPAHVIVAEPGTITGSIGVVTGKFVVAGALEKLGVGTAVVTDGARADMNSPFREFTPAERAKVSQMMRETYDDFVAKVAASRQRTTEQINEVAQGRVWTGRQAKDRGLVDVLGGLDTAISIAKERAKIPASTSVALTVYPGQAGLLETLTQLFSGGSDAAILPHLARMPSPAESVAATMFARITRYRAGEPLTLMTNGYLSLARGK